MSSQDECQIAPSYQINVGGGLVPFIVAADITQGLLIRVQPGGRLLIFLLKRSFGKRTSSSKTSVVGFMLVGWSATLHMIALRM